MYHLPLIVIITSPSYPSSPSSSSIRSEMSLGTRFHFHFEWFTSCLTMLWVVVRDLTLTLNWELNLLAIDGLTLHNHSMVMLCCAMLGGWYVLSFCCTAVLCNFCLRKWYWIGFFVVGFSPAFLLAMTTVLHVLRKWRVFNYLYIFHYFMKFQLY